MYVYIYIYIYPRVRRPTANLRTKTPSFRGSDPRIVLISRGGILMSMGMFPESLSQAILVGIVLIGRLRVAPARRDPRLDAEQGLSRDPPPRASSAESSVA